MANLIFIGKEEDFYKSTTSVVLWPYHAEDEFFYYVGSNPYLDDYNGVIPKNHCFSVSIDDILCIFGRKWSAQCMHPQTGIGRVMPVRELAHIKIEQGAAINIFRYG